MEYKKMNPGQLKAEYAAVCESFETLKARKMHLDMSRGKPGKEQLDMVSDILTVLVKPEDCVDEDGMDARNYGGLAGLQCARAYFADVLGCAPGECIVGGNSSLQLMHNTLATAYIHGMPRSEKPWAKLDSVKFLCPSPGYDRHFRISESFGMEMIVIPMTDVGPDMDAVEEAVKDPAVKGMWCVPKYSNPEGVIYSAETMDRIANLHPAAPDFLLMWDNAYCVHTFDGAYVPFPDMLAICRAAGNGEMVFEFASTSKITFPGSGICVLATSVDNIRYMLAHWGVQTIGYDKVNQIRHVRYLKDKAHTLELMQRHGDILRPKFHAVLDALDREIAPCGIAAWKRPKGGYFVSVDTMDGLARRTLVLCKEAGVVMTGAGATFPLGNDPRDRNIRIAPSMPPVRELESAMDIFCVCLRRAALEKLLGLELDGTGRT